MDRHRYLIKPDSQRKFSLFQKQLMAIFVIAACAFLLTCELGMFDELYNWIQGR